MADSTSAFLPEVSAKRWGWQWNTVKRCQIVKPLQLFGRRFDPDQLVTWNIKILWSRICIDQYLQIPQKIWQCVACKTALENLQRFYPRAAKILWNIWVWWKPMFLPGDAATQHSSAFVFAWFAPTHWNSYDTSNKVHYSTHQKIHNHNSSGLTFFICHEGKQHSIRHLVGTDCLTQQKSQSQSVESVFCPSLEPGKS